MATAVAADAIQVIGTVYSIPIADIEIGARLRAIDPVWAAALGKVMVQEGQRTNIEVARYKGKGDFAWSLISGAHRIEGLRLEGVALVKAVVLDDISAAERKMQEVSENLWRRDLAPVDRAVFVKTLYDVLRERAGVEQDASAQSVAATARWQRDNDKAAVDASATIADAYGWDEQIGEQLGLSARTIRNDLMLQRRLPSGIVEQLRQHRHCILGNATQLRALAKLDARDQERVVSLLIRAHLKNVGEALAQIRNKPAPDPDAKRLSAFIGNFQRMGAAEKKGALAQLTGMLSDGLIETLIADLKKNRGALLRGAGDRPQHPRAEQHREELADAIAGVREIIGEIEEDEVIADLDRMDTLRRASGRLQLAAMPLYSDEVAMPGAGA